MLKIRLARAGKRNSPFFRVVLTEHTKAPQHWYKEVLGFFNPLTKEFKLKDLDKVRTLISNWAQFSEKIEKLLKKNEISL